MAEEAQLRAGSDDIVRDAWVAHHERLWRALVAWSADREVASDAVAEAFAQVTRRGASVDDVGAWVWRAAFRIAAGLLAERQLDTGGHRQEFRDLSTLPADAIALVDALDRLSPTDRQVVVLSLVGGWSAIEIGLLVGATPGSVRVRLHRARRRLRTMLEDSDD
jgi:RNA polymerase sigma factor (sigma-70 family)